MKKLLFQGRMYNGIDPETKNWIDIVHGATVEMSDKKADQLLADFPKDWKVLDSAAAVEPTPVRAPTHVRMPAPAKAKPAKKK